MDVYGNVWIYDFNGNAWTAGPDLNQERMNHACGTMQDLADSSTIFVVVGGEGHDNSWKGLSSAEV